MRMNKKLLKYMVEDCISVCMKLSEGKFSIEKFDKGKTTNPYTFFMYWSSYTTFGGRMLWGRLEGHKKISRVTLTFLLKVRKEQERQTRMLCERFMRRDFLQPRLIRKAPLRDRIRSSQGVQASAPIEVVPTTFVRIMKVPKLPKGFSYDKQEVEQAMTWELRNKLINSDNRLLIENSKHYFPF